MFYIGDGLIGDGSGAAQQFVVPAGATRLFLGIPDAPAFNGGPGGYGDNFGSFTASFVVTPEPSSVGLDSCGHRERVRDRWGAIEIECLGETAFRTLGRRIR